jgi:hypothetical protein
MGKRTKGTAKGGIPPLALLRAFQPLACQVGGITKARGEGNEIPPPAFPLPPARIKQGESRSNVERPLRAFLGCLAIAWPRDSFSAAGEYRENREQTFSISTRPVCHTRHAGRFLFTFDTVENPMKARGGTRQPCTPCLLISSDHGARQARKVECEKPVEPATTRRPKAQEAPPSRAWTDTRGACFLYKKACGPEAHCVRTGLRTSRAR